MLDTKQSCPLLWRETLSVSLISRAVHSTSILEKAVSAAAYNSRRVVSQQEGGNSMEVTRFQASGLQGSVVDKSVNVT